MDLVGIAGALTVRRRVTDPRQPPVPRLIRPARRYPQTAPDIPVLPKITRRIQLPMKKSSADMTQNAPDADDLLYWPQAKQGGI